MSSPDARSPSPDDPDNAQEPHGVIIALRANNKRDIVLAEYITAGRRISLLIHPYLNLQTVFLIGIPSLAASPAAMSDANKAEYLYVFNAIHALLPSSFDQVLDLCSREKPSVLQNLVKLLEEASVHGRSDDVGTIKGGILDYIEIDESLHTTIVGYATHFPMPKKTDNKCKRGWSHPQFARLLVPMQELEDFKMNPERFMDNVQTSAYEIDERGWPAFLYDEELYDPADECDQKGLFRGYLLPIVFRHIFTSPRTALEPTSTHKGGRKSKAQLYNLVSVTGRTIAYVAVMVRIALSSSGWGTTDGLFDYQCFYQNIVNLFESDPDDPWVQETLQFWNEQVPRLGNGQGKKKIHKRPSRVRQRTEDPFARIVAQRARAAAQAQAPQAPSESTTPTLPIRPPSLQRAMTPPPSRSTAPAQEGNPLTPRVPTPSPGSRLPSPQSDVRPSRAATPASPLSPVPPSPQGPTPPIVAPRGKRPAAPEDDPDGADPQVSGKKKAKTGTSKPRKRKTVS